jgi:hypothetical protein
LLYNFFRTPSYFRYGKLAKSVGALYIVFQLWNIGITQIYNKKIVPTLKEKGLFEKYKLIV